MKKRVGLLIFLAIITVLSVNAISVKTDDLIITKSDLLNIETLPVKDSISRFENAEFEVLITNRGPKIDYFSIDVVDPEQWRWVRTDPLYYVTSENKIYPESSANFTLIFVPKDDTRIGIHNVILKVSLKAQDSKVEQIIPVYVGRKGEQEYLPNLNLDLAVPKKLDPRENNRIRLIIDNNNYRSYFEFNLHI